MAILCQSAVWPGELTASIGGEVRTVESLQAAERVLVEKPAEVLVVIGTDVDLDEALAFASHQRMRRPAVGVVLIRAQMDVQTLTRALQAGVREVVPAGGLPELAEACNRSRALSRSFTGAVAEKPEQPQGKIITVFSAKGGCGKTTVAINLACALAQSGKRVCLVDLDLAFGDVAINLQLEPDRTLVDAVAMAGRLDQTGASSLLTPYKPGLAALLAPVSPGDAEKIPPSLVTELLGVLRTTVDYVVVDTPSQFSEHVLNAMDISQHHMLLTTPDVPALKNLRLTLDMLDLLSYSADARYVVLNRSDAKVGLTPADVERVVRGPIGLHVPSSRDVPISINKGTPIIMANPQHPVSVAIGRFAQGRLIGGQARPAAAAKAQAKPAKQSGFGKMLKARR